MSTLAILPVKRFDDAKQRLGETLAGGTRRALAEAMLADVLTALRRARRVEGVVVVTAEHAADALSRAHEAQVIRDPDEPGHSQAASHGVRWAVDHGARRVLLVPGDCPVLDPAEVDDLLIAHPHAEARVTIVPDRHGTGTNALVLTPPGGDRAELRARQPGAPRGGRARPPAPSAASPSRHRWRSTSTPPTTSPRCAAALGARTGGAAYTRGVLARLDRR